MARHRRIAVRKAKRADGQPRDLPLKFDTLGSMPDEQQTTVRLTPGKFEDFALSSAVDASGKRWAAALFFGLIGIVLLGGVFGLLAFAAGKQWRMVRKAARTGGGQELTQTVASGLPEPYAPTRMGALPSTVIDARSTPDAC